MGRVKQLRENTGLSTIDRGSTGREGQVFAASALSGTCLMLLGIPVAVRQKTTLRTDCVLSAMKVA